MTLLLVVSLPGALCNLLDLRLNLVRFLPVADGLVERDDVVLDIACLVPSPSLQKRRVITAESTATVGAVVAFVVIVVVVVFVAATVAVVSSVPPISVSIPHAGTRGGRKRRHGEILEMLAVRDKLLQTSARGHMGVFAMALEVEVVASQGTEDGFAFERRETLAAEADGGRGVGVRVDGRGGDGAGPVHVDVLVWIVVLVAVAERVHLDAVVFGGAFVVGFDVAGLVGGCQSVS